MPTQINKRRFSPPVITVIALAVIVGISLLIRMVLPYDQVFVHGSVWFRGTDAYYFMRHIENTALNFPHINVFDPYLLFPGGSGGPSRPFFIWLVAGIAWLVGLGSPGLHTIQVVGAWVPPILGTLTIIAVYFIGKELFNRWVGLLSAALLAILPGEFLNRSLLGFTDHHAIDSLLSTVAMLFVILAIRRAKEKQLSFTLLLHRDWPAISKPLIYASIAGIFIGMQFLSWKGALLITFIVSVYLVIQFIIDHLRGKSTDYLCTIGTLYSLVAFIVYISYFGKAEALNVDGTSLLIALIMPIVLSIISRIMAKKSLKPVFYPVTLVILAAISLVVFHAINPSLLQSMLSKFGMLRWGGAYLTIEEVQPLLFPSGQFSLKLVWSNFTTSFFISFISLGLLIHASIKNERADRTLFIIWSITTLLAVLGQRRFGDYFAINAVLLTGYFSWWVLELAGLQKLPARARQAVKAHTETMKKKKKAKAETRMRERASLQNRNAWIRVIVAGVIIISLVFLPNISKSKALASSPALLNQGWYNSLEWLRDNSPEPFGNPDFFYELYKTPFHYPETAYGIMSWWDYGYWITYISHRIPNSNPGQGNAAKVASFFIAQDEDSANKIMDKLGSKYVIIDQYMPIAKFDAIPQWADKSAEEYWETYYRQMGNGELDPITLCHPSYYRSMLVRLYNFDGKTVLPSEDSINVISWEWEAGDNGTQYKVITNSWTFSSYEEAEDYLSSLESGNYSIVSTDPFVSLVPLEEVEQYKLVYASSQLTGGIPSVKIFEYTG